MSDIVPAGQNDPQLPAFMQQDQQEGTENLGKFIQPPRMKVVQKQSPAQILESFDPGDVILAPQNVLLAKRVAKMDKESEPFHFIPLFFFPEYIQWNDRKLADTESPILQRTMDPATPLARLCRNANTWQQNHPKRPEFTIRNCEHLNFLCLSLSGEMAYSPFTMSFSRTTHKVGQLLCSLIRMRKAPIYGCIFEARSKFTTKGQDDWYTLVVSNPAGSSGVVEDEALYTALQARHREFAKLHKEGVIETDYDEFDDAVNEPQTGGQF